MPKACICVGFRHFKKNDFCVQIRSLVSWTKRTSNKIQIEECRKENRCRYTNMVELIKAATNIFFRGKDQGLTVEMLEQIGALSKTKNYGSNFNVSIAKDEKHVYWYAFSVSGRQASSEEVSYLIGKMKKICEGIEVEFDVEQYAFPYHFEVH